jgi:hypothetical protein
MPAALLPKIVILAGRRSELTVDHGEAGALARAVRPDERKDLARFQCEAHIADRLEAGIQLAEVLRDENAHRFSPRRREGARARRQASNWPTRPFGNSTTSKMMRAPRTSLE